MSSAGSGSSVASYSGRGEPTNRMRSDVDSPARFIPSSKQGKNCQYKPNDYLKF